LGLSGNKVCDCDIGHGRHLFCIFFTIQASIVLLTIGLFIYLCLIPVVEASEQTILQKVITPERQGRVFGFAQSVEQAASPITAFIISNHLSIDLIKYLVYNACMDKFSALADPTRRKILEILARDGQLPATEISEQFSVSPQAISQHLKVLRQAKLVQVEKRAQQRLYQINPAAMLELEEWARQMRQLWNQRFDAIEKILADEKRKEHKNEQE
jgi:DNA-binding transcriptional ArsR family regulator